MSRKFLIPLVAAAFLAVPAFMPTPIAAGVSGSALAEIARVHKTQGSRKAARATTVKRSKSNSNRMGGGGKGGAQFNPQPLTPGGY